MKMKIKMKMKKFLVLAFAVLLPASLLRGAEVTPPNIVLIYADDLGYGDVGCYGATKVQTPNIDRLAKEGRRFTDAHSASAVCTPSRYGLLTGEYPMRAGLWGPCLSTSKLLLDTHKLTIASLLKQKGYATSCFGKWHLGFGNSEADYAKPLRPGPQDVGFDYYFGVPVVNSLPPYVFVENDHVVGMTEADPIINYGQKAGKRATPITPLIKANGNRVPNMFGGAVEAHRLYNDFELGTTLTERATQWIRDRAPRDQTSDPFFLYFATTNIHHPITPAKRFQGTSQCGLYGDFIHELDWIVGEVMKTLEEQGVADNTLVVFTSDNGGMFHEVGQDAFAHGHKQNGDLLGYKFGVWEGGQRVPFIARWPGKIKPATTSDQLISSVDMLATFAALSDQEIEPDQLADSVNVLPALLEDPTSPIRDHLILSPRKFSHISMRKGKWMYIPAKSSGGFTGNKPGQHGFSGPAASSFTGHPNSDVKNGKIKKGASPAQLYDLELDVNQTHNLFKENPEVVQEMKSLLTEYQSKAVPERKRRKK